MGIDTRNFKTVVIYKSLDNIGENPWVRYYDHGDSPWTGTVERDGQTHERFTKLC